MDDLLNIGLSNALAAALLALVALAVGSVCRRPALVHGLWLLVLLKLVTPPLVRIPIAWNAPSEADALEVNNDFLTLETTSLPLERPVGSSSSEPVFAPIVPVTAEEELSAPASVIAVPPAAPPWSRIVPVLWLAGSLAWFALACVRLVRFQRLLRYVRPAPAALQERARLLARRLDMTRCPAVGLLPGRLAPMLWAIGGSPRLLLPANLLDRLDDEHLDTLLVHELAHLRRRDHWVRVLEFAVMGLYWWHPVVWYARRELREAEEQCCDAWVVSTLPGAGRTYASALMDTLDFLSTAPAAIPPLASGLGQVSDLKRRLTMILRGTTPRALNWPGCFAVLALGTFLLPLLPALQAQTTGRETPKKATIEKPVEDRARTAADLEKAKADLAQAETELQVKLTQVQQARAALEAAEAERLRNAAQKMVRDKLAYEQKAKEQLRRLRDARDQAAPRANAPMIRIEILVSAEGLTLDELRKKLANVMPDKNPRITIQWPAADHPVSNPFGRPSKRVPDAAKPAEASPQAGPVPTTTPPSSGAGQPGSLVGPAPTSQPPGAGRDNRINELEQKLEKLLREMQELRKEMKTRPGTKRHSDEPSGILYDKNDN